MIINFSFYWVALAMTMSTAHTSHAHWATPHTSLSHTHTSPSHTHTPLSHAHTSLSQRDKCFSNRRNTTIRWPKLLPTTSQFFTISCTTLFPVYLCDPGMKWRPPVSGVWSSRATWTWWWHKRRRRRRKRKSRRWWRRRRIKTSARMRRKRRRRRKKKEGKEEENKKERRRRRRKRRKEEEEERREGSMRPAHNAMSTAALTVMCSIGWVLVQ